MLKPAPVPPALRQSQAAPSASSLGVAGFVSPRKSASWAGVSAVSHGLPSSTFAGRGFCTLGAPSCGKPAASEVAELVVPAVLGAPVLGVPVQPASRNVVVAAAATATP